MAINALPFLMMCVVYGGTGHVAVYFYCVFLCGANVAVHSIARCRVITHFSLS